MFCLKFLGGAAIQVAHGAPGGRAGQARRLALLALLATARARAMTREKLIAYLWPEAEGERGRRLLSESLYVLRKALGDGALASEGDSIRLDPELVSCDVVEFEVAVERGDLETAVSVYGGPFLDGFFVRDAPQFERWVESERRRLAECYAEALERLAEEAEAEQDHLGAIGWWQRLVAYDPYNSRCSLGLMRVLAAADDPANAIRQAEEHASLLERELGVEPPEDLLAYAEQLKHERLPAHGEDRLAGVQGAPATVLPEVRGAAPASARRRRKARHLLWVMPLAVAGAIAVVAIWPHGPQAADHAAPAIAVLPFSIHGEGLDVWREGLVDLLSADMNDVGGLRTIDSRTLLARWHERVPETGEVDRATALEVAQAAGARYALLGSAVAIGPEVRLTADIYDVEGGAQMGTVSPVEGSLDSVWALVDRLAVQTLVVVLGQEASELPPLGLASVTTASIPALTAWLEAEALLRRCDFEAAVATYERAVAIDSTFALALYGLGQVYGWLGNQTWDRRRKAFERAMRWVDRLPAREAALLRGIHAWEDGASGAEEGGLREAEEFLQRLVRIYPDYAEAWFVLGELYYFAGSMIPVSLEDAQRCFTRAAELDPQFAPYRWHVINLAFQVDPDSAEAARLIEDYKRLAPADPIFVHQYELGFDLAFGDQEHREQALACLDTVNLQTLLYLPHNPPLTHPSFWPQYEAVMLARERRGIPDGYTTFLFQGAAMGRGYLRKALEYLDRPQASRLERWCLPVLAHTDGLPVPRGQLQEAAAVLSQIDTASGPGIEYIDFTIGPGLAHCAALLAAAQGRWADHARAVELVWDVWRREVDSGRPDWRLKASALAVEAYGLWRQGDSEAALERLEEVKRYQATSLVRRVLGQVLMDVERWEDAVPYLRWGKRTWQWPYSGWGHYHLARAYEGMGEYGKAAEAYAFFIEAWEDADPELQPWVEDARRALARLSPRR